MATITTSVESKIRCAADRIKSVPLTAGSNIAGGTWDFLNNAVVLFPADVASGDEGAAYYEIEDVLAPKKTGETWSAMEQLYYDATLDKFTDRGTHQGTHVKAGVALGTAGTAATEGPMHLIGDAHRR